MSALALLKDALAKLAARAPLSPAESAAVAAARAQAPEQRMLQGVYRGYAGDADTPVVYYHAGTYEPGTPVKRPLYMSRDPAMAQSYLEDKGGQLLKLAPRPRRSAPEGVLEQLARQYVPDNAANGYTPASALDRELHGDRKTFLLENALRQRGYDSAVARDVSMGGRAGEALAVLPEWDHMTGWQRSVPAAPAEPAFTANQRQMAEYYARRRAAETGQAPHVEMLMIDPFIGRRYGIHPPALPALGVEAPKDRSVVRKIRAEDVKERTQLYRRGGLAQMKECTCHGSR